MFRCLIDASICSSLGKWLNGSVVSSLGWVAKYELAFRIDFIATWRPEERCRQCLTVPCAPEPRRAIVLYSRFLTYEAFEGGGLVGWFPSPVPSSQPIAPCSPLKLINTHWLRPSAKYKVEYPHRGVEKREGEKTMSRWVAGGRSADCFSSNRDPCLYLGGKISRTERTRL